ncbi:hypothetical protein CC1G_07801 [Coprinopsis cinerea okayama7|uniref:Uncharacterized protein n=1 Tax=Coprinopsis cinerea (strain Okayama-7 / 130 / ATCC MYA-4618 / FGSC 9003) TaxID=240176 RepID=A8NP38_COPC7|nr:hypothetical protein CC1G_07801 [Coprinopsis cinerea okayama7\|eukprot:XP_001835258.1 hypothetical protein CC1G_07801 [Coprinopsis cinerea okayama7\
MYHPSFSKNIAASVLCLLMIISVLGSTTISEARSISHLESRQRKSVGDVPDLGGLGGLGSNDNGGGLGSQCNNGGLDTGCPAGGLGGDHIAVVEDENGNPSLTFVEVGTSRRPLFNVPTSEQGEPRPTASASGNDPVNDNGAVSEARRTFSWSTVVTAMGILGAIMVQC